MFNKMNKKGFAFESITKLVLWIMFLILAGASIYFLFKRFGLR